MKTIKLKAEDENKIDSIKRASQIIKSGGLVAFPTETVYGLGANALNEKAIEKIYEAKGRPSDNPLIVHLGYKEDAEKYVQAVPAKAALLMDAFWPGALTIILHKKPIIPHRITGGLNTVALRMPDHEIALSLIRESKMPIAAPSANLSGKPSPTKAEHVIEDMDGRIEGIICGGDCTLGIESTVIDLTVSPPVILRPGGVTKEAIEQIIGPVDMDAGLGNPKELPKSPGMKYKHYAPKSPVIVYKGELEDMVAAIIAEKQKREQAGSKVGILASDETKQRYEGCVLSTGSRENPQTIAQNIFNTLRLFDKKDVDVILCESFDNKDIGFAVMNRIIKSAGYNVIEV